MNKKELNEQWKASVISSPQFSCGRLDMQSCDASDCQQEKYVYVAGGEEGYQIKGRYCDEIAYAAAHYQEAIREIERLKSPWVSVDDRMPEGEDIVLTRGTHAYPVTAYYVSLGPWWYEYEGDDWVREEEIDYITHWMPIPTTIHDKGKGDKT